MKTILIDFTEVNFVGLKVAENRSEKYFKNLRAAVFELEEYLKLLLVEFSESVEKIVLMTDQDCSEFNRNVVRVTF